MLKHKVWRTHYASIQHAEAMPACLSFPVGRLVGPVWSVGWHRSVGQQLDSLSAPIHPSAVGRGGVGRCARAGGYTLWSFLCTREIHWAKLNGMESKGCTLPPILTSQRGLSGEMQRGRAWRPLPMVGWVVWVDGRIVPWREDCP